MARFPYLRTWRRLLRVRVWNKGFVYTVTRPQLIWFVTQSLRRHRRSGCEWCCNRSSTQSGDSLSPLWVLQRVGHCGRGNRDIAGGSWRPENAACLYTPPSATSLPAQTKLTHIVLLGFTTATTAGYLLTHYRLGNSSSPSIFNAMDAVLSCIMHLPSFYFFESNNFHIIGPKQSHCSGEWQSFSFSQLQSLNTY